MTPMIIDDLLPPTFTEEILHTLTMPEFDWHYRKSISYGDDEKVIKEFIQNDSMILESSAFSHRFYYEGKKLSQYCDFIRPILYFVEDKTSIKPKNIQRMRAVFTLKDSLNSDKYNVPHVDLPFPHKTLIYYLNDSDSGTILFKEKYDSKTNCIDTSKKTVDKIVNAKKGRILIFDGLTYHTGVIPKSQDKILININFV